MKEASNGRLAFFTPTFSTASLISAGLYACRLKIGACGADTGSAILVASLTAGPTSLPARATRGQKSDDLRGHHLHQRHRWKDHGVADVGPLGLSHLRR